MTATPTPGTPENTGAVTSGTEKKVTAATGGSLTGGLVLGTIVVWLVHRYTGVDLTPEQGALIATALGSTATAAFGYVAKSRTSAVSSGFDRTLLTNPPHRPRRRGGHPYERGMTSLELAAIVSAVCLVVIVVLMLTGGG